MYRMSRIMWPRNGSHMFDRRYLLQKSVKVEKDGAENERVHFGGVIIISPREIWGKVKINKCGVAYMCECLKTKVDFFFHKSIKGDDDENYRPLQSKKSVQSGSREKRYPLQECRKLNTRNAVKLLQRVLRPFLNVAEGKNIFA